MQVKEYKDGTWHLRWLEGGMHMIRGGTDRMWQDEWVVGVQCWREGAGKLGGIA